MRLVTSMIALGLSQSCSSSAPYHCASGASTSPKTPGRPGPRHHSSHDVAHPLPGRLRSVCGPVGLASGQFAVTETIEHPRIRAQTLTQSPAFTGDFRPYSLTFAELEGIGETGVAARRHGLDCGACAVLWAVAASRSWRGRRTRARCGESVTEAQRTNRPCPLGECQAGTRTRDPNPLSVPYASPASNENVIGANASLDAAEVG